MEVEDEAGNCGVGEGKGGREGGRETMFVKMSFEGIQLLICRHLHWW